VTDISKAWVWVGYRGIVEDNSGDSTKSQSENLVDDSVVPFRVIKNSRSDAMGQSVTGTRTKFGLAIAASILIGAFFKLIAFLLFLVAALLIASGKEPQKTEDFLASLPGGDYVIKALARVDGWLS
jgi:hypothetical protein